MPLREHFRQTLYFISGRHCILFQISFSHCKKILFQVLALETWGCVEKVLSISKSETKQKHTCHLNQKQKHAICGSKADVRWSLGYFEADLNVNPHISMLIAINNLAKAKKIPSFAFGDNLCHFAEWGLFVFFRRPLRCPVHSYVRR